MRTALITGASKGLGLALADRLADQPEPWHLVLTARGHDALAVAEAQLRGRTAVTVVPGDVADPVHRDRLADVVGETGRLDLLVNNASDLGPSPLPAVVDIDPDRLLALYRTNVVAPIALVRTLLPALRAATGTVINVSSDAAVGHWPGWGPYGSAKAALDHLSAVLAEEEPTLHVHAFDPGDMRTDMHQAAFPGEDISDRPEPSTVPPAILQLLRDRSPSGRYRAVDLLAAATGVGA